MKPMIVVLCLGAVFSGTQADSLNCRLLGSCDTPGMAYGVAVAGTYAYVADAESGLRVIDVSDPQNPHEVGFCSTPGAAYGVADAGDYAYVADAWGGLRVIDVSDPQSPKEAGFYDTPADGVAVAGTCAYVAAMWNGPRVIDVSAPWNPQEVGFYRTPGWARDVAVAGAHVYVAAYGAGLQIVEFYGAGIEETPSGEVRAASAPTIVRGVLVLGAAGSGQQTANRAELMDITGRKVIDLQPGDNDIRHVAPGVYFVKGHDSGSQGAENSGTRKVVVAR